MHGQPNIKIIFVSGCSAEQAPVLKQRYINLFIYVGDPFISGK